MFHTALLFLAETPPARAAGPFDSLFIPIACFGVIFYFGIIRPQQKRQKAMQQLISNLKTGDQVVTTGGIHGWIANVKDGPTLTLKIAENVKIEVDKSAIVTIGGVSPNGKAAPAALPSK